jgi:large subunit ribosomal protein L13
MQKCYVEKPANVQAEWLIINAENLVLGRLASQIVKLIRGKHKPTFTPHTNCGDRVIVINAEKVKVTGKKLEQNKFYWHTGYPGGIKERKWETILNGSHPERLLQKAVERMMPKESPLAREQMSKNLMVFAGAEHPHAGQQPRLFDISTL